MALQTKNVTFTQEKKDLQGHLAWNDDQDGTRPAVLVFPEWWGLNDYIKKRAEQVAALGYLAMGVDMYGNGKTADHPEEAGSLMNGVLGDLDASTLASTLHLVSSTLKALEQAKADRDAKDDDRDATVRAILAKHAKTCEITLIGEFEAPEWVVQPAAETEQADTGTLP